MANTLAERFRIEPGKRVELGKRDPADASAFPERGEAESQSEANARVIIEWQDKLFAEAARVLRAAAIACAGLPADDAAPAERRTLASALL